MVGLQQAVVDRIPRTALDRYAERSERPQGVTKTAVRVANLVRSVEVEINRSALGAVARTNRSLPVEIVPCGADRADLPNGTPRARDFRPDLGNREKPRETDARI